MKSRVYLLGLLCATMIAFSGCKTKESAYKQAYETAQARSTVASQTPASQTPATPPPSSNSNPPVYERPQTAPYDDPFQTERVTVMDGRTLRQYSVVIGTYAVRTNANREVEKMQKQGYSPIVAQNEKGQYRVIVATFDTRAEATAQRDAIKRRYPEYNDAWLLNRQY